MKIWKIKGENEEVLERKHTVGTAATAPDIAAVLSPE